MRICPNCRAWLDDNAGFCTQCGTKIVEEPAPAPEAPAPAAVPETPVTPAAAPEAPAPVNTADTAPAAIPAAVQPDASYAAPENSAPFVQNAAAVPPPPAVPVQKEKMYFGKGALIFCLIIIALLSVSTGIFAGLYFSALPH